MGRKTSSTGTGQIFTSSSRTVMVPKWDPKYIYYSYTKNSSMMMARIQPCQLQQQQQQRQQNLFIYKTVSYKRYFFEDDFYEFRHGSWNDDIIISAYMGMKNIKKIVVSYDKDTNFSPVVESFPVIGHLPNERGGCWHFRNDNSIVDNHNKYYELGYLER